MARVAVIGGGIVGVCCAVYARRAGHEVTLYERGDIGGEASYGNAGIMSSGGCVPMALPGVLKTVPKMLLAADGPLSIRWSYIPRLVAWMTRFVRSGKPARVEEISCALHRLLSEAQAAYDEIMDKARFDDHLVSKGLLFPFSSQAAFAGSARARAIRAARGVTFEVVDADRLRALEPALHVDFHNGILFEDARHTLDPGGLAKALARDFVAAGGHIENLAVQAVTERHQGVEVQGSDGHNDYDFAVIAAGVWSRRLLANGLRHIPLESERGYHAMLPTPAVAVSRPMIFSELGFAVTPMRDGLRVSGLVEFAGLRAPPDFRKAERMLRRAKDVLPAINTAGAKFWMGHRPSMPDSMPVLGPSRPRSRLLLAVGHGHQGMGFAAITGKIIAALISGTPVPVDIDAFSPMRFTRGM